MDDGVSILIGLIIGMVITLVITAIVISVEDPESEHPSEQTLNDICIELIGNETAIGKIEDKKLICEVPSFDATHNIIIRGSG